MFTNIDQETILAQLFELHEDGQLMLEVCPENYDLIIELEVDKFIQAQINAGHLPHYCQVA